MAHVVQVLPGNHQVVLPDGGLYDEGDTVTLTDSQWSQVEHLVGTVLSDQGAVPDGSTGALVPHGATHAADGADPIGGIVGPRGYPQWVGTGPPGTITGAQVGDEYLDQSTGTIYTLQ